MNFFPPLTHRADDTGLADAGTASAAELHNAFEFQAASNSFLGGWAVLRDRLEIWSRAWDKRKIITMLDVGTGAADLPNRILSWGRRRRFCIHIVGIDSDGEVLRLARERNEGEDNLALIHSDLRAFAALGARFDYVLGSHFLHRLPPEGLVPALRQCDRLAIKGMFFSDLRRCAAAYAGVSALARLAGSLPRGEGPTAVRRAFLPAELETAADEAGLGYLRVRRGAFFRLSLAGEKC